MASAAACLPAAMAQTISLNPYQSTFVDSANPTDNYGGAGALEVSATGSAKGNFDSLMDFNLSGAVGVTVQSITLQLVATTPNNGIFNSSAAGEFSIIWMDNSSWPTSNGTPMSPSGSGVNYNTLPNYLDSGDENVGTFEFTGATSGTFDYSLDLSPGLVGAISSGSDVSLEIVPDDTNVSALFVSGSFTTASERPLLTVVAVPEPASALLLAGPLAILGWRRYGRRKA